ncbi:plasmid partitioning protein RepB C-terminal domain-containing protein [Mesorhizobium huakuii]|uniref:Plasmid partitioning protein RepB C-terminal domain-containing protein n=1 Tax=Mesorhizobium huakuii TaxID=28104 RepID=A0ABZ0W0T7_9HYPH|nr:plasmid partitioning protein RepB C-terminal domain-containing protein [Mesorhizobium huakuii]WQC02582.1 plasmid partitioning protein RepB C-terminal domain-containing protein [Mesorhizobium huakuii]
MCPDVLDFLQDCLVKVKIFGLLRHVLPASQFEIARLMVAMQRVTFTHAKTIAFAPRPLLAEGFHPAMIANVYEEQLGAMTPELGRRSSEFLSAVERLRSVSLELVAAGRYLDRLMDNSRVERYLPHTFPGNFEEFHELSCGHTFSDFLGFAADSGPQAGPARRYRSSCRKAPARAN